MAALVVPSVAMAEPWTNETAMRNSPPGAGRNTFIYDPGPGHEISRAQFVQAPLSGYYQASARGFDANFLTWAPKRQVELGSRDWSGCVEYAHPEPCPSGYYEFDPVSHAINEGPLTVLYWNGDFIATVCGNFSKGGGAGPMPTVSGIKYEDLNADGKREAGEPGLSGWTIRLRYQGNVVATTTTGAGGHYSFDLDADHLDISAGSFRVEEAQKEGWLASEAPGSFSVPFGAEETSYPGRDFGNYRPATIAGHKYDDSNVNGERDPLENGLGKWTIPLSNGEHRVTDGEGAFSFSVHPGTYTVSELLQEGWRQTDPGGEGTRTYTVISGQEVENADFGNVCLGGASISPVDDSTGEPAPMKVRLEEVSVPGILENDPSLPRTLTGAPTFDELLPGTYRVVAFLPEGLFTTDPDAVPIEGQFAITKEITVNECETAQLPLHLFTGSDGKVTGGVKIDLPGGFATSGFEFMTKHGEPRGTLQFNDHVAGLTLHTSAIEAIHVDGDTAWIWGKVELDGGIQRFRLRLVDAAEPGTADRYELTLSGGYRAGQGETLRGGNVQIH
ncbi:MAG TPA: SdrD B-like domain-containing protein [Solirubrobacterales bacterium]|nr:SdrD B-like domain-containing protein [Solirubrobacterales bacterium]